ncbi:hypothetical protein GCK72_018142 [Caenorhabditis remanei]|uniref:Uncharacterized protein n=1 Tax=Caenorhabditis remanei TaxID=31234 RepID=A0A6A5G905_CAERE|nr:hypothetical protein GCK72_018142 [Caenorhabditis remanei]KAF1751588.1 hypothetical protein GCK72_018142 [Caenorhabditis remanei]
MVMFYPAVILLASAVVSVTADPFIYNVYSSSGSQNGYGNGYGRDEVYIRRPGMSGSPYYSGVGNQMMSTGGYQGYPSLQGLQGLQGMQTIQSVQGMQQMPYGLSSSMMGMDTYGSSMYNNKPRFAASDMMGSGQPLVLNGYPMYPRSSGYPMVIPLAMGSFGSSPTVYQGPTVQRLPFSATQRAAARYFY